MPMKPDDRVTDPISVLRTLSTCAGPVALTLVPTSEPGYKTDRVRERLAVGPIVLKRGEALGRADRNVFPGRPLTTSDDLWRLADVLVAQLQRRLKSALDDAIVLADGRVLAALAPGLDAQLDVSRASQPGASAAVAVGVFDFTHRLVARNDFERWQSTPATDTLAFHSRVGTKFRELPHAIHFWDGEHEAVVTFVTNPFTG
ncbi:MAG: hypothetical protein H6706_09815 [Myxococcales bacterium]|nr:hypothetical protein [Myxococcales bacterium]